VLLFTLQVPLSELLYVADNLAYFSYHQVDEPLFVMNHIDVIVSTSGSLVLDIFSKVTAMLLLQLLGLGEHASGTIIAVLQSAILCD